MYNLSTLVFSDHIAAGVHKLKSHRVYAFKKRTLALSFVALCMEDAVNWAR